ncbi:MAG: RNA polymerase sigma factor RpoD/SigA, partial [Verrucomicrobiota bacterium]
AEYHTEGPLAAYMKDIGSLPLISVKEEKILARRIQKGDEAAREKMIQSNLRLVVKIAQDYSNYGLPLVDLISEGNIGLMKGVERFDPERGVKFSTYAAWWIKQGIKRALANQSKTIRLPVHLVDKLSRMRRISAQLTEELGREPDDEELAEELGLPVKKIAQLRRVSMRPASLNHLVGDEDSTELGDLIADEKVDDPADLLTANTLNKSVVDLLPILDDRERRILEMRFPMDGSKPMTLEDIGKEMKVTRERIRQLQNQALKKIKAALDKMDKPSPAKPKPRKRKTKK